jgi:hypothetical protein
LFCQSELGRHAFFPARRRPQKNVSCSVVERKDQPDKTGTEALFRSTPSANAALLVLRPRIWPVMSGIRTFANTTSANHGRFAYAPLNAPCERACVFACEEPERYVTMKSPLVDDDGTPIRPLYARRVHDRLIAEMLGLVKGVICDGNVTEGEAVALTQWLRSHPDAAATFPGNIIARTSAGGLC